MSNIAAHDPALIVGILLALGLAVVKFIAIRKHHDARIYLRVIVIAVCLYLIGIWTAMLFDLIPHNETGVLITLPAYATLLTLEIIHAYIPW